MMRVEVDESFIADATRTSLWAGKRWDSVVEVQGKIGCRANQKRQCPDGARAESHLEPIPGPSPCLIGTCSSLSFFTQRGNFRLSPFMYDESLAHYAALRLEQWHARLSDCSSHHAYESPRADTRPVSPNFPILDRDQPAALPVPSYASNAEPPLAQFRDLSRLIAWQLYMSLFS